MSPARRAMGCCLPGLIDENACRLPDFPPGLHRQPPLARRVSLAFLPGSGRHRWRTTKITHQDPNGPLSTPDLARSTFISSAPAFIFGASLGHAAAHRMRRTGLWDRTRAAGATARIAAPAARARNEIIMLRREDEMPAKAYVLTPQQLLRSPIEDHSEGRPDAAADKASAFQIPLERSRFFAYTTISRALGLKRAYI